MESEMNSDLVEIDRNSKQSDFVLSVIVPVFNEGKTIGELLARVLQVSIPKQVIVVDDGSTDGSVSVLEEWEGHPDLVLLSHSSNRGKGAALRTGLEVAEGHFTIIQDADLEYDPNDYERLLQPLLNGSAQVVYGSRYLALEGHERYKRGVFDLGIRALNVATSWLYGVRLTDEATCYKVFPTELLKRMDLQCERFEFCPEVTAKTARMGITIHEVPIAYDPRSYEDGKKIRLRDGWEALNTLWRWRKWTPEINPAQPRADAIVKPESEAVISERSVGVSG